MHACGRVHVRGMTGRAIGQLIVSRPEKAGPIALAGINSQISPAGGHPSNRSLVDHSTSFNAAKPPHTTAPLVTSLSATPRRASIGQPTRRLGASSRASMRRTSSHSPVFSSLPSVHSLSSTSRHASPTAQARSPHPSPLRRCSRCCPGSYSSTSPHTSRRSFVQHRSRLPQLATAARRRLRLRCRLHAGGWQPRFGRHERRRGRQLSRVEQPGSRQDHGRASRGHAVRIPRRAAPLQVRGARELPLQQERGRLCRWRILQLW